MLDQELSFDELQEINGGVLPLVVPVAVAVGSIGSFFAGLITGKEIAKG